MGNPEKSTIKSKINNLSKNITHQKMLWGWITVIIMLIAYYFVCFGLEPLSENLFGNYSRRIEHTYFGNIRTNIPLLPDKLITLISLGGVFVQMLLMLLKIKNITSNPLTRMLTIISVLALLPLGLYVFVYAAIVLTLAIFVFIIKGIFQWILRGSVKQ